MGSDEKLGDMESRGRLRGRWIWSPWQWAPPSRKNGILGMVQFVRLLGNTLAAGAAAVRCAK